MSDDKYGPVYYNRDKLDYELLTERLIDEIRQRDLLLTEVKNVLRSDERVCSLSVVGGIRALITQRDEAEAHVKYLEDEFERLKRGK